MKKILFLLFVFSVINAQEKIFAQETDSLLEQLPEEKKSELVTNTFKSSRVVNNHSVEMIGGGVLDTRILHRFGFIKDGINELFGLDQASMRLGFDYGITNNVTIGIGRSTFQKELDGFVKWRFLQQRKGDKNIPLSLIWVSGITTNTLPAAAGDNVKTITDRTGYYHEFIAGRKFNENFSLQISSLLVHRNRITPRSDYDKNNVTSLGLGLRYKFTKRVAFIADYNYILSGLDKKYSSNPLGIGFDIETGGHVFQLHFSNSRGMNENAFLTTTTNKWDKLEINFGFNLSRVFSVKKHKIK